MIKNLSNLLGAQELSTAEQKTIIGARPLRRCCEWDYNSSGVLVCTLWVSGTQYCP